MTPDEFKAWRKSYGMSQSLAADRLGISRGSVELYEAGQRRDDGRKVEIPYTVDLACHMVSLMMTVEHGVPPTPYAMRWAQEAMLALNSPRAFISNKEGRREYRTAHEGWQEAGRIDPDLPPLIDVLRARDEARAAAAKGEDHDAPA